ncbi:hypothetical protein DFQ08_103150 [Winogradskyella arenosi]|uniref:Uncharacterized protein n=1 Tax=Winogradskyella arenosi TaxID=533325 RepID=A0A368ZDJ5_9FLAO|nr:hypothetical protein DFQ08_103150 [Winogradskyella arenosi]
MGIIEKAIYFSKISYSDNTIKIAVDKMIKMMSKVLFLIMSYF